MLKNVFGNSLGKITESYSLEIKSARGIKLYLLYFSYPWAVLFLVFYSCYIFHTSTCLVMSGLIIPYFRMK